MKPALLLLLVVGVWQCAATELITCPATPAFNGCFKHSCQQLKTSIICTACGNGYVLVKAGTTGARCDCAPGFGGKGNHAICTKCPEDTQVARGGPKSASSCYNCPDTTTFDEEQEDCVCPAGSYRDRDLKAGSGMTPVKCTPCTGSKQFAAVDNNVLSRCSLCRDGKVANNDHTLCVDPTDPNAFKSRSLLQAEEPSQEANAVLQDNRVPEPLPQAPAVTEVSDVEHQFEELVDFSSAGTPAEDLSTTNFQDDAPAAEMNVGRMLLEDSTVQFQQEVAGMLVDDNAIHFE